MSDTVKEEWREGSRDSLGGVMTCGPPAPIPTSPGSQSLIVLHAGKGLSPI